MVSILTDIIYVDIGFPALLFFVFLTFVLIEFLRCTTPTKHKNYFKLHRILIFTSLSMVKCFQVMIRDFPNAVLISSKKDKIPTDHLSSFAVPKMVCNLFALACSCLLFGVISIKDFNMKKLLMSSIILHIILVFLHAFLIQKNLYIEPIFIIFNILFGIFEGVTQICKYRMEFLWYEWRQEYAILSALLGMETVFEMWFGFQINMIVYESFEKQESMLYVAGILLTSTLMGIALLRPIPKMQDDTKYYQHLVKKYYFKIQDQKKSSFRLFNKKKIKQNKFKSLTISDISYEMDDIELPFELNNNEKLIEETENDRIDDNDENDEEEKDSDDNKLNIHPFNIINASNRNLMSSDKHHEYREVMKLIKESNYDDAEDLLQKIPDMYSIKQCYSRSGLLKNVLWQRTLILQSFSNFCLGVLADQSRYSLELYFTDLIHNYHLFSSISLYIASLLGFFAIFISMLYLGSITKFPKVGRFFSGDLFSLIGSIIALFGHLLFYVYSGPFDFMFKLTGFFVSYFGRIISACMINFDIFESSKGYKFIGLTAGIISSSYYFGLIVSYLFHEISGADSLYLHMTMILVFNLCCVVLYTYLIFGHCAYAFCSRKHITSDLPENSSNQSEFI